MLVTRFKEVPNVDVEDIKLWLETSYGVHGVNMQGNVTPSVASLILLHAEADGTNQIALRTSHYYSFTDKDEAIDKSMISESYRKTAEALWKRYDKMKAEGVDEFGGSKVHYMRRLDRDYAND